jgi:phage-related protein
VLSLSSSEAAHSTICAHSQRLPGVRRDISSTKSSAGREPDDWKPMNTVGRGVREIRIRDAAEAFRVLYVAKFDDALYVLHCFQKKDAESEQSGSELAAQRYRDLLKELGQ